jgi:hypothetical protein
VAERAVAPEKTDAVAPEKADAVAPEKADADVQISGPQTLAILDLLIVLSFCTPLAVCFWMAVLGPAIH